MADLLGGNSKDSQLKRLVAQERTLLQEKTALEQMLKNVQELRNKLKVEQLQLSSNLKAELGQSETYMEVPLDSLKVKANIVEEEKYITVNKPLLDLKTDHFQRMFLGGTNDGEEFEEDDDESDDAMGCVEELMEEHELGFSDF